MVTAGVGGQSCQLSLCSSVRKGGKEEATIREQVQSEATEASESWLICASCKLLLLYSVPAILLE